MERTTSQDIREEGKDLREAAEQSLNVILDVTLDGKIRWASDTWQEVVGTPVDSIKGKLLADLLVEHKSTFDDAIKTMKDDDSRSRNVRFAVLVGPLSALNPGLKGTVEVEPDCEESTVHVLELEGQGILVYDRSTGEASHVGEESTPAEVDFTDRSQTMWMIRPFTQKEVTIDLPAILVESLGEGAELLAQHLTQLAEAAPNDPQHNPPPLPVLCRICERQITPWWFPKHTELCLHEHRAEADLQMAQEHLTDHRAAIVKVLDSMEAQSGYRASPLGDNATPPIMPEYKGMTIGINQSPSLERASPGSSPAGSRERPSMGQRARSWAVRRPLARIVELVLDLCDTALEISQPALKEVRSEDGELRTQSPQSENRITQVLQWQSPTSGYLEHEPGLVALCDDTSQLSKAKVESVLSFRRILEYSERIRNEFTALVQDCIDAALTKAARIAAGEDSSSGEEDTTPVGEDAIDETVIAGSLEDDDPTISTRIEFMRTTSGDSQRSSGVFGTSYDGQSAMSLALRQAFTRSPSPGSSPPMQRIASTMSTRSSSPKACPTPRTLQPAFQPVFGSQPWQNLDTDTGGDSDSSVRSSVRSRPHPVGSPDPHIAVSRVASRERKRKSLVVSRASSVERVASQSKSAMPSMSPLRVPKPRLPSSAIDLSRSPLMSPVLAGSEFVSPSLPPPILPFHRRQSSVSSNAQGSMLSPRLSMGGPQPRAVAPSIKDFEIIKPISKGAFGSVYLTKKKSTGDYYAIKALKKADMVAKNQVANVKAERAIMMWQGESDFVAKLYWTFPSKDYVFLVMEYLNGGDCASLVHALGTLPEEWAKRYFAEIVLGVEHLHNRGIVHRDLKPDNLLIDQKGHLKLTDFGLSRMGLIGRQKRALNAKSNEPPLEGARQGHFNRSVSMASSRSASVSFHMHVDVSPGQTPSMTPVARSDQPSYFALTRESSDPKEAQRSSSGQQSDQGDPDQLEESFRRFSLYGNDMWNPHHMSPRDEAGENQGDGYPLAPSVSAMSATSSNQRIGTPPITSNMAPPPLALFDPEDHNRKFVGTPDYLSPETINGVGQDETSDWWSLGCILFEFLFGYPPFHADTPEAVFEKILARDIDWPEDDEGVSEEAKDLMNKLMCTDPTHRLGSNADEKFTSGGDEIRSHPWFADIDWPNLTESEATFIPAPANPEDTEYFDTRGAVSQDFAAEFEDQETSPPALTPGGDYERPHDALSRVRKQVNSMKRGLMPLHIPPHVRQDRTRRSSEPVAADDFGQFSFKNLPVLEKANKDVIQKLRAEAMQAQSRSSPSVSLPSNSPPSLESSPVLGGPIRRSISKNYGETRSISPSLLSHAASSPSRASQPSSPLVHFSAGGHHERRKTSSTSSTLSSSMALAPGLQLGSLADVPRLSTAFKSASTASSPVRSSKSPLNMMPLEKSSSMPISSPNRMRSHTVGSQDSDSNYKDRPLNHHKRRSQVVEVSPSSSDTDDPRQKALLRVQRRRQSSRRLSVISFNEGPLFRVLDVLVAEDHPISSLVMTKLLEKLRCRTIITHDGAQALRYATGSVKFDIIMMEFKLPGINGADVARMIRETKNTNTHTPIVAVTGYLKELQAPHHFDALVEKPPTMNKLTETMQRLCAWRPPPAGAAQTMLPPMPPSGLRTASIPHDESPSSLTSDFAPHLSSSYRGSSRQDSLSSVSAVTDELSTTRSAEDKAQNNDWRSTGLSLSSDAPLHRRIPSLLAHETAPASMESVPVPTISTTDTNATLSPGRRAPSADAIEAKRKALATSEHSYAQSGNAGDDEDEELGRARARSRSPKQQQQQPMIAHTAGVAFAPRPVKTTAPSSGSPPLSQGFGHFGSLTGLSHWRGSPLGSPSPPSSSSGIGLGLLSDVIDEEEGDGDGEGAKTGTISPPVLFSPRLERVGKRVMDFDVGVGGGGGAGSTGPSTPMEGSDLEKTPRAGNSKDVSPGSNA